MDESVKRTGIGGRRLFPFPICEIIETPLTLHRWFVPRKRSRSSGFCRGCSQTFSVFSSLVFDRRLQRGVHQPSLSKYAQLVSWIKVYPSDVKQPWNVSWSKYRRTLRRCHAVQRLIHPLSFSILLLLEIETEHRERTYSNIFAPRFQIIRENSSLIRSLYAECFFPFFVVYIKFVVWNLKNSRYSIPRFWGFRLRIIRVN